MAKSSSCNKCGAKLVPGADICDLCGTLISTDGASVPDWIDVVDEVVPAYRTIPDPIRPDVAGTSVADAPEPVSVAESGLQDSESNGHTAEESDPVEVVPEEDFFDAAEEIAEPAQDSAPKVESERATERVAIVEEENFFSSDHAESTADEGSIQDVPSEMARARSDGDFESADVAEAEDFFSDSTDEGGASSPEGPTEMEQARQESSFEAVDVVEAEDFFGSTEDTVAIEDAPPDTDEPTEMDIARQDSSFEVAPIADAEDFFGGGSSDDSSPDSDVAEAVNEGDDSQIADQVKKSPEPKESAPVVPLPAARKASSRKTSTSRKKKKRRKRDASRLEAKQQSQARSSNAASQSLRSDRASSSDLSERNSTVRATPDKSTTPSPTDDSPRTRHKSQAPSKGAVAESRAAATPRNVSTAKPRSSSKTATKPAPVTAAPNRNAIVVTAAAVLLIGGLFMINALSQQGPEVVDTPRPQMTAVSPIAPPPLSEDLERQADQLKNQAATLSGSRRISKQRELIALYAQERRFDLAAVVQQEIAEALNSEVEWVRSGNYFYDWMETQTGATKTDYAKLAIASYQRALDINPDNLDVRTNMALAYLYDPSNPMQAIRNTNLVLEKDPNHILANFNRGVMLMQINRLDQALEQFERVQTLVGDSNSPVYQRAENAIQTLRQHRNQ